MSEQTGKVYNLKFKVFEEYEQNFIVTVPESVDMEDVISKVELESSGEYDTAIIFLGHNIEVKAHDPMGFLRLNGRWYEFESFQEVHLDD